MKVGFFLRAKDILFLILVLLLGAACGNQGDNSSHSAGAAGQDVLTVYTFRQLPGEDTLYARFEQLSGLKVEVIQEEAQQLSPRLRQEGMESPADIVIYPEVAMAVKAKLEGLLQPVELSGVDQYYKDVYRDEEGYWMGISKIIPAIAYSTERADPKAIDSFVDLAMPRYRGKVLVPPASDPYLQSLVASFILHNGEEAAMAWASAMTANFARPPQGNGIDQLRGIAAGEGDVAIINASDLGYLRFPPTYEELLVGQESGLVIPRNGQFNTHVNIVCAAVPRSANADFARRYLEYMASKRAQEGYPAMAQQSPVNVMVAPTDFVIEEVGSVMEDDLDLGLLGLYNQKAADILQAVGWGQAAAGQ